MSYQTISDALKSSSASTGGGNSGKSWTLEHQIIQDDNLDPSYAEAMSRYGTTVASAFNNSMEKHINEDYQENPDQVWARFQKEDNPSGAGGQVHNRMQDGGVTISWTGNGGKIHR